MPRRRPLFNRRRHLFAEGDDRCVHCGVRAQDSDGDVGCEAREVTEPAYMGMALTVPEQLLARVAGADRHGALMYKHLAICAGAPERMTWEELTRRREAVELQALEMAALLPASSGRAGGARKPEPPHEDPAHKTASGNRKGSETVSEREAAAPGLSVSSANDNRTQEESASVRARMLDDLRTAWWATSRPLHLWRFAAWREDLPANERRRRHEALSFVREFGSWANAVRAAGIRDDDGFSELARLRPGELDMMWTVGDVRRLVCSFVRRTRHLPTAETWRVREGGSLPSWETVIELMPPQPWCIPTGSAECERITRPSGDDTPRREAATP